MTDTDWYFHLDGDDILPNNAIELVLESIKRNPEAEYITGSCEHFDNIKTNIIPPSDNIELLCFQFVEQ